MRVNIAEFKAEMLKQLAPYTSSDAQREHLKNALEDEAILNQLINLVYGKQCRFECIFQNGELVSVTKADVKYSNITEDNEY